MSGPPSPGVHPLRRLRQVLVVVLSALTLVSCSTASERPGPEGSPGRPLLPVTHWQEEFDAAAEGLLGRSLDESRSADSWDHYDLSYAIDGYTRMFEATGQRRYADRALEFATNMAATARPSASIDSSQFRDAYLGWTSERSDVAGTEVPLFESYAWRYVARLLRVVRQDPTLYSDAAVRATYDGLLAFTERDLFEKWTARGVDEYVFRNRTHMASHWAFIASELAVLTTDEARRSAYRRVADAIDTRLPNHPSSLREQFQLSDDHPGAYVWSGEWGSDQAQDVDHGNGDISYVVEAHDLGRDWTPTDLQRFSATLTDVVMRTEDSPPEYVDGEGRGSGWISDGFVKLGAYDPRVQARLEAHTPQNEQFYAAMALNAKRLGLPGAP